MPSHTIEAARMRIPMWMLKIVIASKQTKVTLLTNLGNEYVFTKKEVENTREQKKEVLDIEINPGD